MSNYIEPIKTALMFFPIIALIINIPFTLIQYHKYGSISFLKSVIIYSFILYLMCAYFLIILPLPEVGEVALLQTPRTQLIPLKFIYDFITETSLNFKQPITYLTMFLDSCFYVPIYNLLLTMPFGIYLRYFYKLDLKKTVLYTLLLSLFFELTQLSGLYFIYPRGYRLFDIDDLILNTLGGLIGYKIAPLLTKKFPQPDIINKKALIKGTNISGYKRFTSLCLDIVIYTNLTMLFYSIFNFKDFPGISSALLFLYYVLIPYILKGSTLSEKFLNLRIVDENSKNNLFKLLIRKLSFIVLYIIIPIVLIVVAVLVFKSHLINSTKLFIIAIIILIIIVYYAISVIKYIFTHKPLLYEKISKTKMISTIKLDK